MVPFSIVVAAALFAGPAQAPRTSTSDPCSVSYAAMMALDQEAFDQDMNNGWRALAARPGCRGAAANLIRTYREVAEARLKILLWHEGQLRAELGETEAAIALMNDTRRGQDEDHWNAYVDATVAFLRKDRAALLAARRRLARFPLPKNFRYMDEAGTLRSGRPPQWPPNLDVVDGLIRCFGKPYSEAYGSIECRQPSMP